MASKLKYQKARLRQNTGSDGERWIHVLPSQLVENPTKGDLVCGGCWTPMKRTRSSRRGTTEVPAYLSLYPNSEHETGCRFSIDTLQGQLKQLHPDVVSVENKVLYLHLPNEERLKNVARSKNRAGVSVDHNNWTATMHSAAAIARFLRQFEDPGEMLDRLKIRYRDRHGGIATMFWKDFCFEATSPQVLKYLRRRQRDGDHTPPVAVIFPAQHLDMNQNFRFRRVETNQKAQPENRNILFSAAESLHPDMNLLPRMEKKTMLVLGRGDPFNWSHKNNVEIRITITERWEFTHL